MQYIKITLKKNLLQLKHTHKTHSSPPPNQNPLPPPQLHHYRQTPNHHPLVEINQPLAQNNQPLPTISTTTTKINPQSLQPTKIKTTQTAKKKKKTTTKLK